MKKTLTLGRMTMFLLLCATVLFSCKKDSKTKALPAPETVSASNNFALKVVISWSAVDGAKSYEILRAQDTMNEEFMKVGTSETNTYSDYDVVSNNTYYYKVQPTGGSVSEAVQGRTKTITPDEAFDALAELTGGKRYNAATASQVPGAIIEVITENASTGTDLVFLIDDTGSMDDDIDEIISSLNSIIDNLPLGTRLAVATYNDANETTNWYHYQDFTTNYLSVKNFLDDINVFGGGDIPESVYDGIYHTVDKLSWASSSKRMIIVIGDAAPLEGSRTTYSLMQVVNKCKSMSITANLFPILIKW